MQVNSSKLTRLLQLYDTTSLTLRQLSREVGLSREVVDYCIEQARTAEQRDARRLRVNKQLVESVILEAERVRLAAETTTELPPGMVVHHIDGNKQNNEISNLALMTSGDHSRLHRSELVRSYSSTCTNAPPSPVTPLESLG